MYTIKSETSEGIYYLCNHWNKNNTFWMSRSDIRPSRLFKTSGLAKRSLKHLLEIMPDYQGDKFSVVEINDEGKIMESEKITAVCISYNNTCSHLGYLDVADVSLICDRDDT